MTYSHPAFVEGFVKQCRARGIDVDTTVALFARLQQQEGLAHAELTPCFHKAAGLLAALKNLGTSAKGMWDQASPEAKGTLVGAGVGGAGGLVLGGKHRMRNALLGALAGGGLGYGAGRTDFGKEMFRSQSQPMLGTGPVEVVTGADNVRKTLAPEAQSDFDSLNPKPNAIPGVGVKP